MAVLYELAVLGAPTVSQVQDLEVLVARMVKQFGMELGNEVRWVVRPATFEPAQRNSSAIVFFGGENAPIGNLPAILRSSVPVIPVVSDIRKVSEEIPDILRPLNCLAYNVGGAQRVATALLESAGLLPKQRRVFVSYKRNEARQAALQLFDAFSERHFDVFLDTHGIAPAEDFQAMLWHRLCDSDVLVMLDTQNYFESRWTSAEFGRALAKGIAVLRVGWPDSTPSARTATTSRAELIENEVDSATGQLSAGAVERICQQLEAVRSESHAVRHLNLISNLRNSIEQIRGSVLGVGPNKSVAIRLADGADVIVYPTLGVPTSTHLHDASTYSPDQSAAVLYDSIGLHPTWLGHLDWLGIHIQAARWVKASEAAWEFAAWKR